MNVKEQRSQTAKIDCNGFSTTISTAVENTDLCIECRNNLSLQLLQIALLRIYFAATSIVT